MSNLLSHQNSTTGAWGSAPNGGPLLDTAFVILTLTSPPRK